MTLSSLPAGLRMRVVIAGLLLAGAVMLFAANRAAEKSAVRRMAASSTNAGISRRIDAAIDTVLRRYGIPRERVTTWRLHATGTGFSRMERRVIVPPEFISLDFNLALSRELDQYNARVIATERTKESTVSIHIVVDGKTTQSVTFITKRDIQ
jgi:hypothetical protein